MSEINSILLGSTKGVCIKPLPQSSSADVILIKRFKTPHDKPFRTLIVGLAVKNFGKNTKFGHGCLKQECKKFSRMFDNMEERTKENFGTMINVLIVCATNYIKDFQDAFQDKQYTKVNLKEVPNITEVILLDLTTTKKRREFFCFNNSVSGEDLTTTLDDLLVKTERERLQTNRKCAEKQKIHLR
jgi:hypothetical protein